MSCNCGNCSECDQLGLAQGPKGEPGVSILHNDISDNSTTATTSEEVLKTYTLPANKLSVNEDAIKVIAWFDTAANGNTKTMTIYMGSTKIAEIATTTASEKFKLEATINRTAASAEFVASLSKGMSTNDDIRFTTDTQSLTAPLVITARGQNGTSSANDITSKQLKVELYKKQ